jgi:hypothetical protein
MSLQAVHDKLGFALARKIGLLTQQVWYTRIIIYEKNFVRVRII